MNLGVKSLLHDLSSQFKCFSRFNKTNLGGFALHLLPAAFIFENARYVRLKCDRGPHGGITCVLWSSVKPCLIIQAYYFLISFRKYFLLVFVAKHGCPKRCRHQCIHILTPNFFISRLNDNMRGFLCSQAVIVKNYYTFLREDCFFYK